MASLQVPGHLLFEDSFEDSLDAFAYPGSTSRFTVCSNSPCVKPLSSLLDPKTTGRCLPVLHFTVEFGPVGWFA
jgi:hypothetical protein